MSSFTRLGHKKSRNGCLRCKKRHVKCDEQQPCGDCVRHNEPCSLVRSSSSRESVTCQLLPKASLPSPSETILSIPPENDITGRVDNSSSFGNKATNIKRLLRDLTKEIDTLDQCPDPAENHTVQREPPTPLPVANLAQWSSSEHWLQDLQLLYHFCSSTYLTMPDCEVLPSVWKDSVPQIAFSYDFLMHSLLAVSALHFAIMNSYGPDSRFCDVTSHHQTIAIGSFSSRLHNVTEDNCTACILQGFFIFLIQTFSIAHADKYGLIIIDGNYIAQSFSLLQGVKRILGLPSAWEWVKRGPLGPLLKECRPLPEPDGEFIRQMEHLVGLTRSLNSSTDSIEARSLCFAAIEELRITYATLAAPECGPGWVWMWPAVLPQGFLDLLSQSHPAALVILSHYVVLVQPFERGCWYLEGWSRSVMNAVEQALDASWKAWIEWPLQFIGANVNNIVSE